MARARVGGKVQAMITVTVTVAVMVRVPVTGIVKGVLMVTVMALCNMQSTRPPPVEKTKQKRQG